MKSSEFAFIIYTLIENRRRYIFLEAEQRRRSQYSSGTNPQFPAPESRMELEYILLTAEITDYYRNMMKVMIKAFCLAKENAGDNFEDSLFQLVKDYKVFPVYTSLSAVYGRQRTPEAKILFERLNTYKPTLQQIGLSPYLIKSLKYDHYKFKEMFYRFNLQDIYDVIHPSDGSSPDLLEKDVNKTEEGGSNE